MQIEQSCYENTAEFRFIGFWLSDGNKFSVKLILFDAFPSWNFQQIAANSCTGYAFRNVAAHINSCIHLGSFGIFFSSRSLRKIIFRFMSLSFDCTRLLTNIAFGFALTRLFSLQMRLTTNNDLAQTRLHMWVYNGVIHSTTASFFQLHKTLLKKMCITAPSWKKNCPKISFYRSVFFNKCHNICCVC